MLVQICDVIFYTDSQMHSFHLFPDKITSCYYFFPECYFSSSFFFLLLMVFPSQTYVKLSSQPVKSLALTDRTSLMSELDSHSTCEEAVVAMQLMTHYLTNFNREALEDTVVEQFGQFWLYSEYIESD